MPLPMVVAVVVCGCFTLQQASTASANPGDTIKLVCETSAASPDLQDAIAVVFDMLRGGDMCDFNGHLLGSHCTTTNSVGSASIGLCGRYDDCVPNWVAARHYWDLILQCASNSFGGSKVGGQVKGVTFGEGNENHEIGFTLF